MLYFYFLAQKTAQKGAGMAEYALLLALIAVVCIAGFTTLGLAIDGVAAGVAGSL